jgi:hypothetical protein
MFLNESAPGGIALPAGLLQSRTNRPGKHENRCHPAAAEDRREINFCEQPLLMVGPRCRAAMTIRRRRRAALPFTYCL